MKNKTIPRHQKLSLGSLRPWTLDLGPCTSKPLVEILGFVVLATHPHIHVKNTAEKLTLKPGYNHRLQKCARCVLLLYN